MGKESDILQAVREQDFHRLDKLLAKQKQGKTKAGSNGKKASVNFQDADGMSALHQASLQGDEGCMRRLLEAGALPDVKDYKGMRPLHYASWQGMLEPVRLLLANGASAAEAADDDETPLHLACQHGHLDVVDLLLQHGANPTATNKSRKTPLDLACEFGKCKIVDHLIRSCLCDELLRRPNCCDFADSSQTTCLHLASKNGHTDVVELLLSSGVDINWQTAQGTALHEAALCGKTSVVLLLIQRGIDINVSNSFDQTALDVVDKFTTRAGAKELKALLHDASSTVFARAVKDYGSAYDKSSLTLKTGDLITVTERRPDGFWKGFLTEEGERTGAAFFPADCVVTVAADSLQPGVLGHRRLVNGNGRNHNSMGPLMMSNMRSSPDNGDFVSDDTGSVYSPLWPNMLGSCDSGLTSGSLNSTSVYPPLNGAVPGGQMVAASLCHSSSCDGRGSAAGRHSVGSHPVHPSSLQRQQSGQSFDGGESTVSGGGASSRRSVRSDDGGGDACSSLSGGSFERLVGCETPRRRARDFDGGSGGGENEWESGYASCSFNPGLLLQQGAPDAEVMHSWLHELHFGGYLECFLQAGYDMPTVSRMTPEDLTAIGITVPVHRRKLTAEIARLNISDGLPDFKPTTVCEWLHLLGLEQYHEALAADGYKTVGGLTEITWEDLEDIGIKKLGHQKKVMLAIEQLKKMNKRQSCSSQSSCGSDVLQTTAVPPLPARWSTDSQGCRSARSVSGDAVSLRDSYGSSSLRTVSRQLSCDSAMTRSLMMQQTYQPDTVPIQVKAAVSRSSSGNSVNAGPVGDYAQPRYLSFAARGERDDATSLTSSEDSGSSAGSTRARHGIPLRTLLQGMPSAGKPSGGDFAGEGGRQRHKSAGSSLSTRTGAGVQYATLRRSSSRSRAAAGGDVDSDVDTQSFEATAEIAASNLHASPFSGFRSPYSRIQSGLVSNAMSAAVGSSPPRGALPLDGQRGTRRHPSCGGSPSSELERTDGSNASRAERERPPDTDSSSECETEGPEFPPLPPPIAFDLQHMKAHKSASGRAPLSHKPSEFGSGRLRTVSETAASPQRRGPARASPEPSKGGPTEAAGTASAVTDSVSLLPFANENVGTIRQRAPSSSSGDSGKQTLSGEDGESSVEDVTTSHQRANLSPADDGLGDGVPEDGGLGKRLPKPVMHVQPVIMSEQRHSLPILHALSTLRHISEGHENDKPAEKDVLSNIGCMLQSLNTELDAILEHDTDLM